MSPTPRWVLSAATAITAGALLVAPIPSSTADTSTSLLTNGSFSSLDGWKAGTAPTRLSLVPAGVNGSAVEVTGTSTSRLILTDDPDVTGVKLGTELEASVWVRATSPKATVSLSVKEKNGDGKEVKNQVAMTSSPTWTQLTVPVTVTKTNARLNFDVRVDSLPVGESVTVDDAVLAAPGTSDSTNPPAEPDATPAPDDSQQEPAAGTLSNGCTHSARGLPSCGAYVGGAYNSNEDPSTWESWLSKQVGVRRTYYRADQVNSAVATAKADAAKNRINWMSFKTSYSWKEMAEGKGDAWARDLAAKLATVDGPVWVAVHHEPENDGGDITQWTAMQARLAPIFRSAGDNIAYSIILMGYHQFFGADKFSLDQLWPKNTTVDIAGFDLYDEYGMTKNGQMTTKHKQFRTNYFEKIQAWAKPRGIRWGLAETGFSEASVQHDPAIMSKTYDDLVETGGIAFAYFNTHLNSSLDWRLNTSVRRTAFKEIHKNSATLR